MRRGPVTAVAVVIFLAITAVLVYLGRDAGGQRSADDAGTSPPATQTTAPIETEAPLAPSTVPLDALKAGDTPPQLVLFSLDGAGSHQIWQRFLDTAESAGARFTAFLTGLNLIADEHREVYTGPGHAPGKASTAFGGDAAEIATEIADLNAAYTAGHEIGTHYNGHFCDGNPPSGNDWSTAEWRSELGQFFTFLADYPALNDAPDLPRLEFGADEIKGGRIPCLEGDLEAVTPVWKEHDMTYDSSKNLHSGIGWPEKIDGIWEFQIPYVYSKAFGRKITLMDYNMWATFNGAADEPKRAPELRAMVRETYDDLFAQVYGGNRAPLVIETHANLWNDDSFIAPTLDFMAEVCGKKDVYCATYSEAVAWLEAQKPKVLRQLQAQPVVAAKK